MRGGEGGMSRQQQGTEAHKREREILSKPSPHHENQFFRLLATVSTKYHFSGLLESVHLLTRALAQLTFFVHLPSACGEG